MMEIIQLAFSPAVLPATILVLFVFLYWMTVLIGLLDFKSLDIGKDLDVDHDVEVGDGPDMHAHAHADAPADAHTHSEVGGETGDGPNGFQTALLWFNLGDVPLMVFLSFCSIFLWAGAILAAYYLGTTALWVGALLFLPLFFGAAVLAKYATTPLKWVFRKMNEAEAPFRPQGKICQITLLTTSEGMGQAKLLHHKDSITLNVRTRPGITLEKGKQAIVLELIDNSNIYLIEPFNSDEA